MDTAEQKPQISALPKQADTNAQLLQSTTSLASAFVQNNTVHIDDLPKIIDTIYHSFSRLIRNNAQRATPTISQKQTIFPDYIVCLEDGKKMKMLKRHLRTNFNLTPEEYRAKWSLPSDYPMVAPSYAKRRSLFAKQSGLGRHPQSANHDN